MKSLGKVTHVQDKVHWVPLVLYPEDVPVFQGCRDLIWRRLTSIRDNGIVVRRCYWTNAITELSGEEIIPWSKTVMFFIRLTFELFVEVWHCFHCVFTKPTMTRIFIQHVTRGRTGKKLSPIVENTLNNVLTLSLRKAANPAVVTIGQFRIALMGTTTKSVLLYSGAEVMMWSIKIIISCQEGILVPFEKPGSL